jgi:hypothetical protein
MVGRLPHQAQHWWEQQQQIRLMQAACLQEEQQQQQQQQQQEEEEERRTHAAGAEEIRRGGDAGQVQEEKQQPHGDYCQQQQKEEAGAQASCKGYVDGARMEGRNMGSHNEPAATATAADSSTASDPAAAAEGREPKVKLSEESEKKLPVRSPAAAKASATHPSSPVKPHKAPSSAEGSSTTAASGAFKVQHKKLDEQQQQQHQRNEQQREEAEAALRSWWLPLTYFPSHIEQEYVQYKHNKNVLYDYYTAAFGLFYCLALVGRMVWERNVMGTAMYLLYIIFKAGVYVPLVLGKRDWFLR